MKTNLRLLPFMIVIALAMLSARVTFMYQKKDTIWDAITIETQTAQAVEKVEPEEAQAVKQENEQQAEEIKKEDDGEKETQVASLDDGDVANFTDNELDILQSLSDRREELQSRERELERRMALVKAAEDRIDSKVNELRKIQNQIDTSQKQIEELVAKFENQEDEKFKSLISTYEKMKPKDAARIFNDLELSVLLDIVRGMKESKVAPVLAAMDPAKAKIVTSELARPRKLPDLITNSVN